MTFEPQALVKCAAACLAFGLGTFLVALGSRIKRRLRRHDRAERERLTLLAAAIVVAGLWWPQYWLAADGLSIARNLIVLVLASAVALGAVAATASFGRRRSKLPFDTGIAIGATLLMTGLTCTVFQSTLHFAARVDWMQAALMSALAWATWALAGCIDGNGSPTGQGSASPVARIGLGLDPLTGLRTREAFATHLESIAATFTPSNPMALMFIDLDGFKPVNDTYGHSVGDDVLRIVAQRLEDLCRDGDRVARVGGDEFLLQVADVPSKDLATAAARRIIETLRQPCLIGERDIGISCSIGIAFYPGPDSMARLIGQADAAMYAAKRAGGSDFAFYTPVMDVDAEDNMQLARDLRRALANNEFELFYQPKIDARTAKITAAEALLRWHHPTRGDVSPTVFIPIAERSGLMTELSNWVVEDACRQGRAWRDSGLRMRVAINLSPQQMRREDFVDHIAASLKKHRIHPSLLTCEITESLAMEDTKATQETFRKLGKLGAHLSIDDFGTGYSSLSYLRRLPARELKIDRSFIIDLESSADARAIVKAILNLSHALGLKVVAEGVENVRQQQILTQLGCDELQGFLFARPMSARALLIWALSDRSTQSAVFTPSLFAETRQAQRSIQQ